jgi:hypothetical protein
MAADVDLTATTVVYDNSDVVTIGQMIPAENMVIVLGDSLVYENLPLGGGGGESRPASGQVYPRGI